MKNYSIYVIKNENGEYLKPLPYYWARECHFTKDPSKARTFKQRNHAQCSLNYKNIFNGQIIERKLSIIEEKVSPGKKDIPVLMNYINQLENKMEVLEKELNETKKKLETSTAHNTIYKLYD